MPLISGVFLVLLASAPDASGCVSCHVHTATIAAHASLSPKHTQLSCVSCHRGIGSAKEKNAAHASGPDELLSGDRTGAACVGCHIAGSVPGTEAVIRGGKIFLERGCNYCHATAKLGVPLNAAGGRGSEYLSAVIHTPKKIFPATIMPASHLGEKDMNAVLSYLLSQRIEIQRPAQPALSKLACVTCHATKKPDTSQLAKHECTQIIEEKKNLNCARCHASVVPASDRECLYIERRRHECTVCHEGAVDGR
jgi:hypothetical protein